MECNELLLDPDLVQELVRLPKRNKAAQGAPGPATCQPNGAPRNVADQPWGRDPGDPSPFAGSFDVVATPSRTSLAPDDNSIGASTYTAHIGQGLPMNNLFNQSGALGDASLVTTLGRPTQVAASYSAPVGLVAQPNFYAQVRPEAPSGEAGDSALAPGIWLVNSDSTAVSPSMGAMEVQQVGVVPSQMAQASNGAVGPSAPLLGATSWHDQAQTAAAPTLRSPSIIEVTAPAASSNVEFDLPSVGSTLHEHGLCTPCHFFAIGACRLGQMCGQCHNIHPGQLDKRSAQSEPLVMHQQQQQQQEEVQPRQPVRQWQ